MTKDLTRQLELQHQPLPETSDYLKAIDPIRQDQSESPQKSRIPKEITEPMTDNARFYARLGVFIFCLSFLVIGRAVIPANEVPTLVDHLMDKFNGCNEYIRANRSLQDILLIICSLFMDVMFFTTGYYWVRHGTSSRLIVATLFFYFLRTAVQQMWYSPYPSGYIWDDPGFPSLVVPYGRTSDFYFSGHIGIVTIFASEWIKWKKYWASALIGLGGVYTCFIMLAFQAHYSIDLFTGIITGHWMFMVVDTHKDKFDAFFSMVFNFAKKLVMIVITKEIRNDGRQEMKE